MAILCSTFSIPTPSRISCYRGNPLKPKLLQSKNYLSMPRRTLLRAVQANSNQEPERPQPIGTKEEPSGKSEERVDSSETQENSEIRAIREVLKERREKEKDNFFSGVLEEVQEIEWPVFRKVLGTTGVVLAVITGSSLVLLTLNAVLAEVSDRVFAGRGVQDFF
ncbi:preprotein translocase subunit SECE1-like [Aristolochia californica]|uniref:preprotein translocase subunit SECE1-like n=1 Tax=Aristolochia californica TaxID=171875 RepID=UPI0035D78C7F